MRRTFTKKDLHTGDIIETRNGERGVVILELDCILYQAGGLDLFSEVITEDLYILYNKYQEERHLKLDEDVRKHRRPEDKEPMVIIPEKDISIHSACMLIRKDASGRIVDLEEGDYEAVKGYLNGVQLL